MKTGIKDDMKKRFYLVLYMLIIFIAGNHTVCTAKWIAGSYGGMVIPLKIDNDKLRLGRGVELGKKFGNLDTVLYIFTSSIRDKILSSNARKIDTFILSAAHYKADRICPGLFLGGRLGIVDRRLRDLGPARGETAGRSVVGYGLILGYEYAVSASVSLSVSADYLVAPKTETELKVINTTHIINFDRADYINITARLRIYL